MPHNIQTSRIFIQDPVHADALGEIYIADEPAEIAKNGYLFILINIQGSQPEYEQFIGAFLEKATSSYYHAVLEEPTKLLEYTLNELNKWVPDNLPQEKNILDKLHIVIGNLKNDILNFSYIGNWQAYLIHKLKTVQVAGEESTQINPVKIFENVITGEFTPGYSFLLTNPSLLDYVALEKVRKIIATIPAKSAAQQLRNLIAGVPPEVSFLSAVIKHSFAEQTSDKPEKTRTTTNQQSHQHTNSTHIQNMQSQTTHSRESLKHLIETEKQTQQVLTVPSSWQTVISTLQNIKSKLAESNLGPILISFFKLLGKYALKLFQAVGGFLLFIYRQLKNTLLTLIKPGHSGPRRMSRHQISNLKRLTSKNKLILGAISMLVIIFIIVLVIPGKQQPQLSSQQFEQLQQEFASTEETIEAALIYGDRIRAQSLLEQLREITHQLPTSAHQDRQQAYDSLRERTTILTERIWNIMHIQDPVTLVNLADIMAESSFAEITVKQDNVYVLTNGQQFLIYNFADKEYQTIDYPGNWQGIATSTLSPNTNLLAIDQQKQFFVAQQEQLQPVLISLAAGMQEITAATSFFNRLYILDKQSDQIYRHRLVGNTFQAPDTWLQDNLDLANAADIAIDGLVYILDGGQIMQFVSGRQQDFAQIDIYPALENPTRLFTDVNTQNLYILDPENQRVVVLNKDGQLQKQYQSDQFGNLQDMAVQEEARRMFLISDDKLFVVPL